MFTTMYMHTVEKARTARRRASTLDHHPLMCDRSNRPTRLKNQSHLISSIVICSLRSHHGSPSTSLLLATHLHSKYGVLSLCGSGVTTRSVLGVSLPVLLLHIDSRN